MSQGTIHPVIVGTAGHVDHGKSSLVRRLTGIDPDRLQEEKERGLTIDLGFAPLPLADGRLIGIIDVPGHERFVKNMVAGATSVDLALLVVAADDAVMPQTREHLDVLELLGVERGIVALTKIDLVDEETRMLAEEDVKELLAGHTLAGSPIVPLSSETGEGIDALKALLEKTVAGLEPRSPQGVFRMPVQRVFSIAGFGTVLTGIPLAGEVAIGDTVELVGKGLKSRVRGIHAYGKAVDRARAGHSTALNLPDIPLANALRGDVVALPDTLEPKDRIEAEIRVVGDVAPIRHGEEVHLHLGTSERTARLFLLDNKDLATGNSGLAQLLCTEPVVALPGDFALIRRLSPARTIAGGRVIGFGGRRLRRFRDEMLERLRAKEAALDSPDERVLLHLVEAGEGGLDMDQLLGRLGWTPGELTVVLGPLLEKKKLFQDPRSERMFARRSVDREQERILARLESYYQQHKMSSTCPLGELRREGGETLMRVALSVLERRGKVKLLAGGMVQDPKREDALSPEERAKVDELRTWLDEAGTRPHTRAELEERFGQKGKTMLERLLEVGGAVAVGPTFVWGGESFAAGVRHVEEVCGQHEGVLDIPSLRDRLGTSRKFLIPFLEHLDRIGVTARKGDRRILRRK